jgi:hypothetical protein
LFIRLSDLIFLEEIFHPSNSLNWSLTFVFSLTSVVPKVRGISEKAAAALITRFGTLDNLMANVDQIEEKRYREALAESTELVQRSLQLVQLKRDIPDIPPIESFKYFKHDPAKFISFCRKFRFLSLIKSEGDTDIFTARGKGSVTTLGIEQELLDTPAQRLKEQDDRPRWMRVEGAVRAKFLEERGGDDFEEQEVAPGSAAQEQEEESIPGLVATDAQIEKVASKTPLSAVDAAVQRARDRVAAIREAAAARVVPTMPHVSVVSKQTTDEVVESDEAEEFQRSLAKPDEEEDAVFETEAADERGDSLIEYADADGHISMYEEDGLVEEDDEYELMLRAVPGRDAVMNDDDDLFEEYVNSGLVLLQTGI